MSDVLVESRIGRTVAIVAGASHGVRGELVRELSRRGCAVVVVYLCDQTAAEAVVQDVNDAGGAALTIRADVTDGLDVERLFDETGSAFGLVDIVVHAARAAARELVEQSVRRLRRGGIVLSVSSLGVTARELAGEIRESGVTVSELAPSGPDLAARQLIEPLRPWLDPA